MVEIVQLLLKHNIPPEYIVGSAMFCSHRYAVFIILLWSSICTRIYV